MLGATVRLSTTLGESIQAVVFAYSDATKVAVLEQPPTSSDGKGTIRLLRTSFIKELAVVSMPASPPRTTSCEEDSDVLGLPFVPLSVINEREKRAVAKALEDKEFIGNGVTVRAQAIFESLRKTMPCEWKEHDILVLNEVRIPPPYTPAACRGKGAALNRVQKVLAGELEKI